MVGKLRTCWEDNLLITITTIMNAGAGAAATVVIVACHYKEEIKEQDKDK